jgi:hypothetical protein
MTRQIEVQFHRARDYILVPRSSQTVTIERDPVAAIGVFALKAVPSFQNPGRRS